MGIKVCYHSSSVILHQKKFVADLLFEYNYFDVFEVVSPINIFHKLHYDLGDIPPQPDIYKSLIGKLHFLTHTRPDFCFTM